MKKFLFLALLGLSLSVAVSAKGNRGGSSRGGSSHKGAHYTNRSGGHTLAIIPPQRKPSKSGRG